MGRPTKSAADRPLWSKRLEAVRTLTGMDQRSFAERLGLQAETYRRYERGETEPNFKTLARLRAETGASLDLIITGYPQNGLDFLSPEAREKVKLKP